MREIKFRAWDSELKFFTSQLGYFVEFDGSAWFNLGAAAGEGDCLVDQSQKLIVEQFTGLRDKSGKEIYEGDIMHFPRYVGTDCYRPWLVEYYNESASFTAWSPRDEAEVIGNIHENPELLSE